MPASLSELLDHLVEYNASKNRFLLNGTVNGSSEFFRILNSEFFRSSEFFRILLETLTIAVNKDYEDDDALELINSVYKFTMCSLQDIIRVDCQQSLFFFRFSKRSARARASRAFSLARSPRTKKKERLLVTRVIICVSRAFCPATDQEKIETALSLLSVTLDFYFNTKTLQIQGKLAVN